MSTWTTEQLEMIAAADDLHISPFRDDGSTYGTPTWIWSVVVEGGLYVRAYNGHASRWYRAAMQQHAGRIRINGTEHEVTFERADHALDANIDDAYRAKYTGSPYLPPMLTEKTQAATVRISPRR